MEMRDCPKWHGCNAPICPLDPEMELRGHCKGEPVCFYLREYVKPGGKGQIDGRLTREHAEAIAKGLPDIISRWSDIKRQLKRSEKTGSRMGKQPGWKVPRGPGESRTEPFHPANVSEGTKPGPA